MIDPFGRSIDYLRVSVTDRCDFRCVYCMAENMSFLPKKDLLTLEELDRLCSAFVAKGVRKLRLTGGEPLVRKDVMTLVRSLSRHLESGALEELTLTTNGSQLARHAADLAACGVKRINVSLDTLDADRFRAITRWGDLDAVLKGIDAALAAGIAVKINAVALKGVNEAEIEGLVAWAHGKGMDISFIEVMPLGDIEPSRSTSTCRCPGPGAARRALDAGREQPPHRRTGPLCRGGGNRRPHRLHHADDPQFLRKLQPRARHLHRDALHVPRPGRCRRPAGAARASEGNELLYAPLIRRSPASRRAMTSSSTAHAPSLRLAPHEHDRRLNDPCAAG